MNSAAARVPVVVHENLDVFQRLAVGDAHMGAEFGEFGAATADAALVDAVFDVIGDAGQHSGGVACVEGGVIGGDGGAGGAWVIGPRRVSQLGTIFHVNISMG